MSGPNATGDYTATYAVTVTNPSTPATTYGPITDTPAFNSNLTISGASWTGQASGSATGAGPYTLGTASTSIAAGATHTYNLTITFRYTGTGNATACAGAGTGLYNAASLPGAQETGVTTDNSACLAAPAKPVSAITLDKQGAAPSGNTAGSTIAYSFIVTNSGTVPLTGLAVSDPKVGTITCPVSTLAAGATTTCTKSYTLTQADVEAGTVSNTASVTGTPPSTMGLSNATATDTVNTAITRSPAITIDKTAGVPSGNSAGSTINYSFLLTNSGNVALNQVGVSDPKVGPISCPVSQLAPGASTTCTKSYSIIQSDVDAGTVNNTATASGTSQTGVDVTGVDTVATPITRTTSIALDKQSGGAQGNTVGSSINYVFLVTNTGNVTLTNVGVTDPTVGAVGCPLITLNPGQTANCAKTYTLTQADLDAGHVANTAVATGTPPSGMTAPTASDSTDTPITSDARLTLDKQASVGGTSVGSTISYSFVIRNTGNRTLSSIAISDPKVGAVTCPVTTLAPNATTTCSKNYTVTQADVNAGGVDNTATVSGTPPTGSVVTATDSNTVPITRSPSISLDKQAGTPTGTTVGSTILYSFVVTNTGNVTLNPISVNDPKLGAITCPITNLAPAATTTCTKTYSITQADVDSGHVANTATATGTPPSGVTAPTASDSTDTAIVATPRITLDKQGGTPSGNTAGSTIAYSFILTNTGNVSLSSVGVSDPKVGTVSCPVTTLAPAATTTCTKSYTLTQADVDAGTVNNTATASGTPPTGGAVTATDTNVVSITRTPAITLDKQNGTPTGNSAGATIAYSFVVKNTGNVTLNTISVSDPKVGTVTCPVTTLAPNATTTCTKSYTVTQADVDSGAVNNTATASGTPPSGAAVTGTDTNTVAIARTPAISIDKQATVLGNSAGSSIRYFFVMLNTGNVTLTNVGVTDPKVGTVTCVVTTIAPGVTTTCTRIYTLTQADVDAGTVTNTATATGTPPAGPVVTATDTNTATITRTPAITLDKQSGTPSGATAGSTIAYSFVVTNSGNVTLNPISVTDPKVGAVTCPVTTLAPNATTTCTKGYTLTQADVNAGTVNNTATASGTPPTGAAVTATDTNTVSIPRTPAITLDKQAGKPSDSKAGSTIDFAFVVQNTGNVTLNPISVNDPQVGAVSCPVTNLAPGATTICSKSYTLTQGDVDSGHVANTATATGTPPSGLAAPSASDSTDTPLSPIAAITLDKRAGKPSGNNAGDTVDYVFVVTNTGDVTLVKMVVSDPLVPKLSCPETTLTPGSSVECTATYTLTREDVDKGEVTNHATVSAASTLGQEVKAEDTETIRLEAGPAIALDKTAGKLTGNKAGDTIDYNFLVTNTGNVTLAPVRVEDSLLGPLKCSVDKLAPGDSFECTETYTLTQADVDAGHVANVATASRYAAQGERTSKEATRPTPRSPANRGSHSTRKPARRVA